MVMREFVVSYSKVSVKSQLRFKALRDYGRSVLSCNVDNLHDILSQVRIDHDAIRTSYPKVTQMSADQVLVSEWRGVPG
jgi:hypothetical protein